MTYDRNSFSPFNNTIDAAACTLIMDVHLRGHQTILRRIVNIAAIIAAVSGPSTGWALAGLSRACPYNEIPYSLKTPFAQLAPVIGAKPLGSFTSLPGMTWEEQGRWWVLESLTIDWFTAKYWLYAENRVYYRDSLYSSNTWTLFRSQSSGPGWTAERVPDNVLNDSTFSIFFANRMFMYSARAGNPDILERLNDPNSYKYRVVGNHYYYDPAAKMQGRLPQSNATNCNLNVWGIEAR